MKMAFHFLHITENSWNIQNSVFLSDTQGSCISIHERKIYFNKNKNVFLIFINDCCIGTYEQLTWNISTYYGGTSKNKKHSF